MAYNQRRNAGSQQRGSQYSRGERPYRREGSQRVEWYDRDPMDERSGYRDEEHNESSRYGRQNYNAYNRDRDTSFDVDASESHDEFYRPSDYNEDSRENLRRRDIYGDRDNNRGSYRSYADNERTSQGERSIYGSSYGSGMPGGYGTGYGTGYGQSAYGSSSYGNTPSSSAGSSYYGPSYNSSYGPSYDQAGYGGSHYASNAGVSSSRPQYSSNYGSGSSSDRSSSDYPVDSYRSGSMYESERGQFYGRGPRSFKRSDDRVKEEVCEMLTRHSAIDADDIEVEVKEGEVTLSGSVPERRMKHLAEDCCEHCYGVKEVTNNIRVKKEASPSSSSDYSSSDRSSDSSRSATDRTGASAAAKKSSSSSTSTTSNPNH